MVVEKGLKLTYRVKRLILLPFLGLFLVFSPKSLSAEPTAEERELRRLNTQIITAINNNFKSLGWNEENEQKITLNKSGIILLYRADVSLERQLILQKLVYFKNSVDKMSIDPANSNNPTRLPDLSSIDYFTISDLDYLIEVISSARLHSSVVRNHNNKKDILDLEATSPMMVFKSKALNAALLYLPLSLIANEYSSGLLTVMTGLIGFANVTAYYLSRNMVVSQNDAIRRHETLKFKNKFSKEWEAMDRFVETLKYIHSQNKFAICKSIFL